MNRKKALLIPLALLAALTCAACGTTSAPNSPASQSSQTLSPPSSSAPEEETVYPPDQPPLSETAAALPAPDFLDEAQRLLYRRAHDLYVCFAVSSSGFDRQYPAVGDASSAGGASSAGETSAPSEMENDIGWQLYASTGRYKTWADFQTLALSLFTPDYFQALNGDPPAYVERDGLLYHIDGDRGANIQHTADPDTFELVSRTDDRVEFNLVGYYWDMQKYSQEQWEKLSPTGSWDTTQKSSVVLEKTADGWRFSEFHITY